MKHLKLFENYSKIYLAYHGSRNSFTDFDTSLVNTADTKRLGSYFTASQRFAETYGSVLYTVELTINNPFNAIGMSNRELIENLPIHRGKPELMSGFGRADKQHYGVLETCVRFGLREELEKLGHDGILYEEGYADAYIVFHPKQVTVLNKQDKSE